MAKLEKKDVLHIAKEKKVRFVRLWFTDILGFLKSFAITVRELKGALEDGMGFDGSSIAGFVRIDESDMVAMPDPSTFRILPWRANDRVVAVMFCDILEPNGNPHQGDPRWVLKKNLERVDKSTPIVLCSHSPIQKIYKGWNFWTDDAESVQALLKPFNKVTVIYGHVHQIQYNQVGNISFHAVMATAWPWPYPKSYVQDPGHLPKLTVPMNRADPFFERDATGWQFINLRTGNVDMHYQLPDNENRSVVFNPKTGSPKDGKHQDVNRRIPPQNHY